MSQTTIATLDANAKGNSDERTTCIVDVKIATTGLQVVLTREEGGNNAIFDERVAARVLEQGEAGGTF